MQALMLSSACAFLEALSPKFTPRKFALEGSFSVVMQYISAILMAREAVEFTSGAGFIAKLLV